jgi:hypothetical protein
VTGGGREVCAKINIGGSCHVLRSSQNVTGAGRARKKDEWQWQWHPSFLVKKGLRRGQSAERLALAVESKVLSGMCRCGQSAHGKLTWPRIPGPWVIMRPASCPCPPRMDAQLRGWETNSGHDLRKRTLLQLDTFRWLLVVRRRRRHAPAERSGLTNKASDHT